MRVITGEIVIPSDSPVTTEATVLIEVRNVSFADALSTVIAHSRLTKVNFVPGDRIPFSLTVPEVPDAQSLDLRIHISCAGINDIKSGDFLTTRSYPLPSRGTSDHISVLVKRI